MTMPSSQAPAPEASSLPARPPLPPFDEATALAKVRAAEDAWNNARPAASLTCLLARQRLA